MIRNRFEALALFMIAMVTLVGCSDDDPLSPGDPEDPRVEAIVITPASVIFNNIGEDLQFDADAFDQGGASIDTDFDWQSSNSAVVLVDENGNALATGFGNAEVYAAADGVIDTAEVMVTLNGAPMHEWIAGVSGNWEDGANWSGGVAPGPGDLAVISTAGTYTVTMNGDVEVMGLVLGDGSGSQTLDTGNSNLRTTTGGQFSGSQMLVGNTFSVMEDFVWAGGDVSGNGVIEVESGAMLHVTGNPVNVDAGINNNGTIVCHTGSSLRIDRSLDNNGGGLFELQGDAFVTVQNNGVFNSTGTILKSLGSEEARIVASSTSNGDLTFVGSLRVESGTLNISGGSLRGLIYIDADAVLRQSGNTVLPGANSQGDGPFVITGRVEVGPLGQTVTYRHIILDSGSIPAVVGLGSLLIDHSFVWRRGTFSNSGTLNTQIGSQTTFESSGTKVLSGTGWNIRGTVNGNSAVNLSLTDGATVVVESPGRWNQTSGGTISQGSGASGSFEVLGSTFHKTGDGTFIVETDLTCSGTLDLREGAVVVVAPGDFVLNESGVITGGGTADLTQNVRLIVVNATSSILRGTVRPDLDGQPARLDIQGLSILESTFRIELDVVTSGPFDTESVYFLTSGQPFGGTLALNVLRPPTVAVEYRVIHSFAANGAFALTGDEPFIDVIQDGSGVVCIR